MDILKMLPNCKILSTVKQEDDETAWLAARTHGLGGSDIGAICGVSPFSSARQIYLKKTGQYDDALNGGSASTERMHFGHMLEPVVANEYALRTGEHIAVCDATLVHKDFPWALANVDRLILDDEGAPIGILECKTTSEYNNDEWENGDILTSYQYQLNWYMWILGIKKGAFACLVGGNKFYSYDVFRDDELLKNVIIPAAKDFWYNNVLKLIEPPMQATDTDFVNATYNKVVKNSEITLPEDTTNDLASTVVDCKAKIKELTSIMEAAQNSIKDTLKENEIGYTSDWTIKWSPRKQQRVDTDKLKAMYPDVASQCMKTLEFRVMTIKGMK